MDNSKGGTMWVTYGGSSEFQISLWFTGTSMVQYHFLDKGNQVQDQMQDLLDLTEEREKLERDVAK